MRCKERYEQVVHGVFLLQKSADVAKRPHSDCSMGSGRNTGVRSSQQAQQVSTHLRIFLLVGISQTLIKNGGGAWQTENGISK